MTASFEIAAETEAQAGDVTITASRDGISRTKAMTILPKENRPPRQQNWRNRLNLRESEAVPLSLGIRGAFFDLRPRTNTITSSHKYYLYTPELNLMAETAASTSNTPSVAYEYVWFNGKPVAQLDVATSTIHSVFTDHLGTPIAETDATGAIDWRAEYEPFGNVTTYRTGATRHQPVRFPGQEYDAADGSGEREYNIFRWYRGGWGRYTQSDPVGLTGGLNLFGYVNGNPFTRTDPFGLFEPGQVICRRKTTSKQGASWASADVAVVISDANGLASRQLNNGVGVASFGPSRTDANNTCGVIYIGPAGDREDPWGSYGQVLRTARRVNIPPGQDPTSFLQKRAAQYRTTCKQCYEAGGPQCADFVNSC